MNYRILGLSGLRVSSVGLGCMGMSHAYGAPADRKEMADLIRTGKILHWGISEPREEIKDIDSALDAMKMSDVFSGSP